MADFQFPNFNLPQFPFQNLPQQLQASMMPPQAQGNAYGRFAQPPRQGMQTPPLGGGMPQLPNGGQLPQLPQGRMGGGNPGMSPGNFGPSPPIPQGGSTQQFSGHATPSGSSAFSQMVANNMSKYGVDPSKLMPQSFSPAQFNQVAQQNPGAAFQMLSRGGQDFRNAVMQGNGWSNEQMNSFINNQAYNNTGNAYDTNVLRSLFR